MNLKCTSTFGNFKWTAEAEVTDAQAEILANAGLLQVLQRSPASKAEKVLAGYEKRPEGFNRSSIEFNEANAKALATALEQSVEIAEGVLIDPVVVEVSKHKIGESALPKFAEEKRMIANHNAKGDLVTWASDKVKFTGEGELDETNTPFLQAVKAYKDATLKSL